MTKHTNRPRRVRRIRFTIADRFLVSGQRLRVDETMTSTTIALRYTAQWQQATKDAPVR